MLMMLFWGLLIVAGVGLGVFAIGAAIGAAAEVWSGYQFRRELNRRD